HATLTLTCILIWHTHTDATVYTISNLPYSHIPLHSMAHSHFISTKCTHIIINGTCLSGLYPVPFTHKAHDYLHFNIYISFGDSKYRINALNTCVIPLLHRILTT
ncbi:hypothetical protein SCY_0525, partial [Saccharomyces cerevisiae YJM789]